MNAMRLQRKILAWYSAHKRDLPWRKTIDPYKILISEVMLQQTQVDRVIPYYDRFLKKYPSVYALSKARNRTLLKLWSGLGYNSRALRLKTLAKIIVKRHNGKFPRIAEELTALPGIGPYTAHAIMAFAHDKEVPVLDTNIRRVLIHELGLPHTTSTMALMKIAQAMIPKGKSRTWHNALMDYGALQTTARSTGVKSLSKQKQFLGSDRWLRGQILKEVLKKRRVTVSELHATINHPRTQIVLDIMLWEGIIRKKGRFLFIA